MKKIVYANDDFVIYEAIEVIPVYEDGTYRLSYFDVIHISESMKMDDNKMYVKYYFKQEKLPKVGDLISNSDRIRSMSDEELAKWLTSITNKMKVLRSGYDS